MPSGHFHHSYITSHYSTSNNKSSWYTNLTRMTLMGWLVVEPKIIIIIHLSSLDRSISNRRVSSCFLLLPRFKEFFILNANSADPDQTPYSAASVQGLHCLSLSLFGDARHKWVNFSSFSTSQEKLCVLEGTQKWINTKKCSMFRLTWPLQYTCKKTFHCKFYGTILNDTF